MTITPEKALAMGFVRTAGGNWLPPEAVQTPKSKQNAANQVLERQNGALESGSNKPPTITISGQIRGGKNNYLVLRNGMHVPKKEWAVWRDKTVAEIKAQLPPCYKHNGEQVNIRLDYWAGDKRRRDQPAIIDSVFHCLERAGFVDDDTLLWVTESTRSYDKANPRCVITVLESHKPASSETQHK